MRAYLYREVDLSPSLSMGVVPSTLHQKLKFVVEGHLVIVSGEEDILVSCPSSMPFVEAAEESLETDFQSFEVVSISSVDVLFLLREINTS